MAELTILEKRCFERLLGMSSGYVLNFSNRTFAEFIVDSVRREISDARYAYGSGSKANLLRGFWKSENSRTVGKLMNDLLDYAQSECGVAPDNPDLQACRRTVTRLNQQGPVPELDALTALSDERDFEVVASAIRESIEHNRPEAGLDRLHTFTVKYIRSLCERAGLAISQEKPLHSLFGEYLKRLRQDGAIESEMTLRILKSSISTFEAFNDVRNNQSLAHDNRILNYEESILIFNHVASSIRFLRSIEAKARPASGSDRDDDAEDIPF